jgi:hypothetical protein
LERRFISCTVEQVQVLKGRTRLPEPISTSDVEFLARDNGGTSQLCWVCG